MSVDQLRVLTVGTLVPKEGMHTLSLTPCFASPPGLESHRSSLTPQGHLIGSTRHSLAGWLPTR